VDREERDANAGSIVGAGPAGLTSASPGKGRIDNVSSNAQRRLRAVAHPPALEQARRPSRPLGWRADHPRADPARLNLCFDGDLQHIDFTGLVGRHVTVYGQTEVTHDLMDARRASSLTTIYEAEDVALHDIARAAPHVTWRKDGVTHSLACDFIAGCDGSHGVSRASIPERALTLFDRHYPFGWLGIMVDRRRRG